MLQFTVRDDTDKYCTETAFSPDLRTYVPTSSFLIRKNKEEKEVLESFKDLKPNL